MTTSNIPGFCPLNSKLTNDSGSDSDSGLNGGGRQKTNNGDYGVLMNAIPQLELLALYTAATMHDYDHPGRTNAFLVATLSQQVSFSLGDAFFVHGVGRLAKHEIQRFIARMEPITFR